MTISTTNGRGPRRTLDHSIQRLDNILDGLADALNEAVADAVRGAVAQAVKEAVVAAVKEVLSHPNLLRAALARHEPHPTPTTPAPQLARQGGGSWLGWACNAVTAGWQACWQKIGQAGGWVTINPDHASAAGLGALGLILGYCGYRGMAVALCGTGAGVAVASLVAAYLIAASAELA